MKIKDLFQEAKTANPSQASTLNDLKMHMPKLKTAVTAFNQGGRLFRGLSYADADILHKPMMMSGDRVSANTENYCTLFVDNHPSWRPYPPRSASMICSTSSGTARGYASGGLYVVLVENDPLVGVCPEHDFWVSFQRLHDLGSHNMDVSDLNGSIKMIMEKLVGVTKWSPKNYQELQSGFNMIDNENSLSFPDLPPMPPVFSDIENAGRTYAAEACVELLKFQPGTTIMDKLEYLLDPKSNEFNLYKLSSMPERMHDREVWTQAPAWFINTAMLPTDYRDNPTFDLGKWIAEQ